MREKANEEILWTAQRHGQDWRDESVLAAIGWLTSILPRHEWERRQIATTSRFQSAKSAWTRGERVALFDPQDTIAWYIHLALGYADPAHRYDFFEPDGYRVAPVFKRLGQLLPELKQIKGVEERVVRLMTNGRRQPDDGIYELLIAAAYKKRGWDYVEFVPETPGVGKSPDLHVSKRRSHWAVECKRAGRSGYAWNERAAGEQMASTAHSLSEYEEIYYHRREFHFRT